jgi:hypothetical protein
MRELVRQKYPRAIYPEHPRAIDVDREAGPIRNSYPGGGGFVGEIYNVASRPGHAAGGPELSTEWAHFYLFASPNPRRDLVDVVHHTLRDVVGVRLRCPPAMLPLCISVTSTSTGLSCKTASPSCASSGRRRSVDAQAVRDRRGADVHATMRPRRSCGVA